MTFVVFEKTLDTSLYRPCMAEEPLNLFHSKWAAL